MLLKAKGELFGKHLRARDGKIGTVRDVYFDDARWAVRYLEIDTSYGIGGSKVLISPRSIERAGDGKEITVALTCEQVKNSPGADQDMPVSRQFEEAHADYYGYPFYWDGPYLWGGSAHPLSHDPSAPLAPSAHERVLDLRAAEGKARQSHLRSSEEVIGYRIVATDGPIGHVEDFVVDDQDWSIGTMLVDTRNWLPGRHVRVPVSAIAQVDWATREVRVELTRDEIKDSPAEE